MSRLFTTAHVHMGYLHMRSRTPRGPTPTPQPLHTSSSWYRAMSLTTYHPAMCNKSVVSFGPGLQSATHRTQLLQDGHSRRVTQNLKMTSFSLSQLKSKLTRFPSETLAARLTVEAVTPGGQIANSFNP